jgi:hypothetical protein
MTKSLPRALTLLAILACVDGCSFLLARHPDAACRQRAEVYRTRAESLERNAQEKLKIGAKKDAVERFFADNGLPLTFTAGEASGTIHLQGCAPSGCGSDDAILGVRVKVDKSGAVLAKPVVGGIYTDCL